MKNPVVKWLMMIAITAAVFALNRFIYQTYFRLSSKNFHVYMLAYNFVLNFSLFGWITLIEWLLAPPLSSAYFNSYAFERNGKIYERLGINLFRKFLVITGWEKLRKAGAPVKSSLDALVKQELTTRKAEFGHGIVSLIILVLNIYVYIRHGFAAAAWMLGMNLLLGIYPIMLQRYNRPRLMRIISIFTKRNIQAN